MPPRPPALSVDYHPRRQVSSTAELTRLRDRATRTLEAKAAKKKEKKKERAVKPGFKCAARAVHATERALDLAAAPPLPSVP